MSHFRAADPTAEDLHAGTRHQGRYASRCDELTEAGLVFAHRRQGSWTYYRVVPVALTDPANVIAPVGAAPKPSVDAVVGESR